ncbi:MAG: efflux transporter, family, subunit [Bryobacterales bacterium]|nr:efflux transporter, family, subunit [Bryobacterales bacterium]
MSRFRKQLLAIVPILLAFASSCTQKAAVPPPPPTEVGVTRVIQKDVPVYGDWVATLDGYVNAQIQPQVSGYLIKQNYKEGSLVHKGDVLFEIDPRPFQAILDQVKGQIAQAKGQLAQAEAQLALAEINVKRDTPLAAAHAIAQSQLDNDVQSRAQAQAAVQTNRAAIQAAEASAEQAELNLGFTRVRSLLDGIAGIATTQMGNLVSQTTVLTSVSQVNPIKAYFPISESEYLQVADRLKPGAGGDWLRNTNAVPLRLTLTNGNTYGQTGHIVFADRQVDPQTGTIRVAGAFANPGNVLRPGQFGRIRAETGFQRGALLVPQRAVTEFQGKYQLAIVRADSKVDVRDVKVGLRAGDMWIILSGVKAGDQVISEGTSKVRDGQTVSPKPDENKSEGA